MPGHAISTAYQWWRTRYCPTALAHRLGVRGSGMILIWVAWSLIGLGVVHNLNSSPTGAPHLIIPASWRAAAWVASGLLALALSGSRRHDRIALIVAVVMPSVLVASYLWAWIVSTIPGGDPGYPAGWYNAAIHLVLVPFVWLVASIVEVPRHVGDDQ